jgi:PHD/YefM family antitoxin component YafN of YafNO toxin-antitoxin module
MFGPEQEGEYEAVEPKQADQLPEGSCRGNRTQPVGQGKPLVITQNGEAKAVIQDIESYEQTQETMALLKILALGSRQLEDGNVQPANDVIKRLRGRSKNR